MTDNELNSITRLIDRFFDGETSRQEEQTLYSFFRRKDLPENLMKYRDMFAWYEDIEASVPAATDAGSGSGSAASLRQEENPVRLPHMRPAAWIGIAASLLLLLTLGVVYRNTLSPMPKEYMAYQGSYIVRDGRKITDLRIVVPEIQRRERQIEARINALNSDISEAEAASENALILDDDYIESQMPPTSDGIKEP